ncbi:hypothetical protein [Brumimicrobium mesophilum]|uniref:hypothetical protein n=1 Tax=Brumimicrobium mesophilum TaxID=392717 RepID=UPI000D13F322|nr:hypothetical protein [Brumimicrobium mesophilum]
MKLIAVLFIMAIVPVSISQNEWWRIGKSSETETKTEEEVEQIPEKVEEATPLEVEKHNNQEWVEDSIAEPKNISPGKINIVKSSAVDKIIKFKSATIPPNMGPLMDGYRIQLFFDQDRSAVDKARTTMLGLDDKSRTYIEYKAPNYFLLHGDYRTQLEAEKFRATIISEFPAALVLEDKIYMPEIPEEEINEVEEFDE